jgi:DNA-binding protein H-NS
MTSYQDLIKQREALTVQIEQARQREIADAVARARALVAEFQLTPQDVFPTGRKARAGRGSGAKVAPKYRNPATGQTWTGRGKAPKWIDGQDRAKFLIA